MIKLSSRLQTVYDMLPSCDTLADVGCDHGYLSIAVLEKGKCAHVIPMDINKGPLESATSNIKEAGLIDRASLRLSDGLDKLEPKEADVICICGMGGILMKRILENGMRTAKAADILLLEPQSEMSAFRSFLMENNFIILDEELVEEENKIYPIIKVRPNDSRVDLTALELKYGPRILEKRPELLTKQLEKERRELVDLINRLEEKVVQSESNLPIENRLKELKNELKLNKAALG